NSLTRRHGQFIVTSADVRQAPATGTENSGVATLHGLNWKSELPQGKNGAYITLKGLQEADDLQVVGNLEPNHNRSVIRSAVRPGRRHDECLQSSGGVPKVSEFAKLR